MKSIDLHVLIAKSNSLGYIMSNTCYLVHKTVVIMDSLDEKIIDLLSVDARQSSEVLAEQLNVSSSTIRRRINNLVNQGIVRFAVLVEPTKSGFSLRALIAFNIAHENLNQVIEVLARKPEVKGLAVTTGRFDVIALAWFTSTETLFRFMENEVSKLQGVINTETFICLHVERGF